MNLTDYVLILTEMYLIILEIYTLDKLVENALIARVLDRLLFSPLI